MKIKITKEDMQNCGSSLQNISNCVVATAFKRQHPELDASVGGYTVFINGKNYDFLGFNQMYSFYHGYRSVLKIFGIYIPFTIEVIGYD